jgi:hypothetical protein
MNIALLRSEDWQFHMNDQREVVCVSSCRKCANISFSPVANYRRAVARRNAERYWNIRPPYTAAIVPMDEAKQRLSSEPIAEAAAL